MEVGDLRRKDFSITYETFFSQPSLTIKLEDHNIYYTNSVIYGYLELSFPREVVVRSIVVTLKCIESTYQKSLQIDWKSFGNSRLFCGTTAGNNVIYSKDKVVHEFDKAKQLGLIGKNLFAFTIDLPKNLPPSVHIADVGSVTYTLKAAVEQHLWGKLEAECEIPVFSPIHLTSEPICAEKIIGVRDKYFLFKKGKLGMKVELPSNCFIPNELVYIKIDLRNFSTKKVKYVRFTFFKILTINMTKPFKEKRELTDTMFDFMSDGIDCFKQCFYHIRFRVPKHIPLYNFSQCSLFQMTFKLSVICHITGQDLKIDLFPNMAHSKWSSE